MAEETKRHIDLAYLTGVFNVAGIVGIKDNFSAGRICIYIRMANGLK